MDWSGVVRKVRARRRQSLPQFACRFRVIVENCVQRRAWHVAEERRPAT